MDTHLMGGQTWSYMKRLWARGVAPWRRIELADVVGRPLGLVRPQPNRHAVRRQRRRLGVPSVPHERRVKPREHASLRRREGEGVAEGALATHIRPPTAVPAVYQRAVKVRLLRSQAEIVVGVDERRPQRLDGQKRAQWNRQVWAACTGSAAATSLRHPNGEGSPFGPKSRHCGNCWVRERWAADGLLRARRDGLTLPPRRRACEATRRGGRRAHV